MRWGARWKFYALLAAGEEGGLWFRSMPTLATMRPSRRWGTRGMGGLYVWGTLPNSFL
jgi:hypothetical protein